MSLKELIADTQKEIAGSRTKNRLTVQISYAIQLIMDFYSTDFLVMMDYIEDVSIICDPSSPSGIHLYQIKTKSADKQYQLSTVINEKWYQKLYKNAQKYGDYVASASVVCNTDIVSSRKTVFHNEKTSLNEDAIQKNIQKIKVAIAEDQKIDEKDVDLSKFYFVRSTLSTKGHKQEVEHEFENFLLSYDSQLQVATVKSIYKIIYDELDEKFNNEIDEECSDVQEIYNRKGIEGQKIKSIISCGLAIQIPTLEKLFTDYNITSISERKRYSSIYTKIKLDMYSNMTIFINLKRTIQSIINDANNFGIDDMSSMLIYVYKEIIQKDLAPEAYREEYYLKMLIMILIYRYCYGGENECI